MTVHTLLVAARAKIDSPDKWTKGNFAADEFGNRAHVDSPSATCWCLDGSLVHAARVHLGSLGEARDVVEMALSDDDDTALSIWEFNDGKDTTHAEVMAVLDAAIEATK